MVDVLTEITIHKPIAEVAGYAMDPENASAWYMNIQFAELKSPKPLKVGSKIAFVAYFLGRKLVYTYEIMQLEPMKLLVMRTSEGPFPMETTYTWTAIDATSTRMSLRNRGVPRGFSRLFTWVLTPMMRFANRKDLKLLKKTMEGS